MGYAWLHGSRPMGQYDASTRLCYLTLTLGCAKLDHISRGCSDPDTVSLTASSCRLKFCPGATADFHSHQHGGKKKNGPFHQAGLALHEYFNQAT